MGVRSYRDLVVWQKAVDLVEACYKATQRFPEEEKFGLTSQIRRAAVSIPANIAEGHGRDRTKAFLNHISIARGSLMELEAHLIISERVGLLRNTSVDGLCERIDEISRMLAGLRAALRAKIGRGKESER